MSGAWYYDSVGFCEYTSVATGANERCINFHADERVRMGKSDRVRGFLVEYWTLPLT